MAATTAAAPVSFPASRQTTSPRPAAPLLHSAAVRASLGYGVAFCLFACWGRFLTLYFLDIKCSASQIGALVSFGKLATMVATPIGSYFADKSRQSRLILLLSIVASMLGILLVPAVGSMQTLVAPSPTEAFGHFGLLFLVYLLFNVIRSPQLALLDALILEIAKSGSAAVDLSVTTAGTVVRPPATCPASPPATPAAPRTEYAHDYRESPAPAPTSPTAAAAEAAKQTASRLWARARMWGAIGWGITHVVLGFLLTVVSSFSVIWIAYQVAAAALLTTVFNLFPKHAGKEKAPVNFQLMKDMLLAKKTFFLNLTFVGGGFSLVEAMLFLALNELDASPFLCGLSVMTTVVFELPIFWFGDELLRNLGPKNMIVLGQVAWIFRAVFYAWMPHADYVLLVEPLHGVTFALVYIAAVQEVDKLATRIAPGMKSSAQGILGMTFGGVGPTLIVLLGGVLFDVIGYRMSFLGFAVVVLVSLLVYAFLDPDGEGEEEVVGISASGPGALEEGVGEGAGQPKRRRKGRKSGGSYGRVLEADDLGNAGNSEEMGSRSEDDEPEDNRGGKSRNRVVALELVDLDGEFGNVEAADTSTAASSSTSVVVGKKRDF